MRSSLLVLVLAACGDDQDPARAAELWDRVHAEDYRAWRVIESYETPRPSRAPHSDAVQIWVNPIVSAALDGPSIDLWPEGSSIVKEGSSDGEVELVAVMEKTGGAWFWAEYTDDGTSIYSGAPTLCVGCHRVGEDFVRGFFLP
jgi:hypothetical protein